MAAAHVFVADVTAPELDDGDRHHLERVLRLRAGEEVTVSDGAGTVVRCVVAADFSLEPVAEPRSVPRPDPPITVAFAVVKGDRPEWAVQKLTEVGVDVIVPLTADRSVVRWDGDRARRHIDRLRRVAREAAMQSRRAWLPEVGEPAAPRDLIARLGAKAALAHPGGEPVSLERPAVLVGPEGGWAEAELEGATTVGLGPTVLRTETAAVAAAVLLCAFRAGYALSQSAVKQPNFRH